MKLISKLLIVSVLFSVGCGANSSDKEDGSENNQHTKLQTDTTAEEQGFRLEAVQNEDETWGYNIYANGKHYIKPTICLIFIKWTF